MRRLDDLRRFNLLDCFAIVAGMAVGFALVRLTGIDWTLSYVLRLHERPLIYFHLVVRMSGLVLVCLSAVILACGLIPRGSARRRRLRCPGLLACLSLCATVPLPAAWYLALRMVGVKHTYMPHTLLLPWLEQAASAVFVAWLTLWLVGRWRPIPCWPDRAGRGIGWACIALELISRGCEVALYAMR